MVVITNTIDYNIAQGVNVSLTFASVLLTTPPNNLSCTHMSRHSISVSTAIPNNSSCFPTISLFKGEAFANIPKGELEETNHIDNHQNHNKTRTNSGKMRFKTSNLKEPKHTDLVSCVSWLSPDDVVSAGDDRRLNKWNLGRTTE